MSAAELSRWTRFAAKGEIGKCTATHECVAEGNKDLMFIMKTRTLLITLDASDHPPG
ncbi:hypothetical protein K435DRAFT_667004 [Dendrothele bispora CBS 962.96]|uniref:Uncharacterized protein n=1 Tax=Dendrothele bispora (strain CBS 962.96) TaxID=1314807 RepID=A0A4V4HFJ6_DENBC|nr:hypothetical protein K435DRAFT_667004 [Dendrothele bispora CBS 962.96]